jgi:hypothetical protein
MNGFFRPLDANPPLFKLVEGLSRQFGNQLQCLFTPLGLTGSSGSSVPVWTDGLGSSFKAEEATNPPTVQLCADHQTPVVQFNGTTQFLRINNNGYFNGFRGKTGLTFLMVFRLTVAVDTETLFSQRFLSSRSQFVVQIGADRVIIVTGRTQDAHNLGSWNTGLQINLNKWHCLAITWNPVTADITLQLDNTTLSGSLGIPSPTGFEATKALVDTSVGCWGASSNFIQGQMALVAMASRTSSLAELKGLQSMIRQTFKARNLVVLHGDSLLEMHPNEFTVYSENERLHRQLKGRLNPSEKFVVRNEATSGRGLTSGFTSPNLLTEAPNRVDTLLPPPLCNRLILVGNGTRNDLSFGRITAQILADIASYTTARKAAGYDRVVWATPITDGAGASTERNLKTIANSLINSPGFLNAVVNLRAAIPAVDSPALGNGVSSVSTSQNTLTLSSAHTLTTGQRVRVDTTGTLPGGLSTSTTYFARAVSTTVISLHPSVTDANNDTNQVVITSTGSGSHQVHFFENPYNTTYYLGSNSPYAPDSTHPTPLTTRLMAEAYANTVLAQADLAD